MGTDRIEPREAGIRLNAEAVLMGSVREENGTIRVNTQLIRVADGRVLWAEGGLDVEAGNLLEAERMLATSIAVRLSRSLSPSQQTLMARPATASLPAYEYLVRAKVHLRSKTGPEEKLNVSQKLLEEAIRLDPAFAEAFAWLAYTQSRRFSFGFAGDDVRQASLQNARKALAIDPSVTVARRALINIFHSTGQAEEGLKEAAILRQSGVSDPDSLAAIAQAYVRGGMPDRAIPLYELAIQEDPEDTSLPCFLSFAACWAGQYELGLQKSGSDCVFNRMLNAVGSGDNEAARSAAFEVLETGPPFSFAVALASLKETGGFDSGIEVWRTRRAELERNQVRNERVQLGLGMIYALVGEQQKAHEKIRLSLEVNPGDPWTLMYAAETYGWLGDEVKALKSLEASVDRGFLSIFYLERFQHRGRGLYAYRNDPRFRAVRERLAAKIAHLRTQF